MRDEGEDREEAGLTALWETRDEFTENNMKRRASGGEVGQDTSGSNE